MLVGAQAALGMKVDDNVQNLKNLVRVSDVLVRANTLANAKTEEFAVALTTKSGAAARTYGKSVEETVAVLAAFATQNTKAQEAGTNLDIVWRDLQDKFVRNKDVFLKHGVHVFDQLTGEMNDSQVVIGQLTHLLSGMSDEMRRNTLIQLGFQSKSIASTQKLLGMADKIKLFREELEKAGGTTDEIANKQLTKFSIAMTRIIAIVDELFQLLALPVLESFGEMVIWVTDAITGAWGPTAQWVTILGASVFAMGTLLFIIPKVIAVFALLTKAILAQILARIKLLALMGPKGWLIIAAAIAGTALAYKQLASHVGKANGQIADAAMKVATYQEKIEAATKKINVMSKAEKDAAEAMKKHREEMEKLAQRYIEMAQTPMDRYWIQLNEIQNVYDEGFLSMREYRRSLNAIGKELAGSLGWAIDSLDTPFEKFAKQIENIEKLSEMGILNTTRRLRALAKARDELGRSLDIGEAEMINPKLIEANTQEAFKADFAIIRGGFEDMAKIAEEHKDATKDGVRTLKRVETELKKGGVTLKKVSGV